MNKNNIAKYVGQTVIASLKSASKLKNSLKHLSMNWGRLSKTFMRPSMAMFKQGTFRRWQTVSLLYLTPLIAVWPDYSWPGTNFIWLFKIFWDRVKNVDCQLVFVWGGRRLSRMTGEAGEKFTRKVYITRILMLITGINTAQICCTAQANIFAVPRSHFSIIDS